MLKVKNMENDEKNYIPGRKETSQYDSDVTDKIIVRGESLTIDDVIRVARRGVGVGLTEEEMILQRIRKSHDFIEEAVESGQSIYGVTTVFGGMLMATIIGVLMIPVFYVAVQAVTEKISRKKY